jgi:hypothetical protein
LCYTKPIYYGLAQDFQLASGIFASLEETPRREKERVRGKTICGENKKAEETATDAAVSSVFV